MSISWCKQAQGAMIKTQSLKLGTSNYSSESCKWDINTKLSVFKLLTTMMTDSDPSSLGISNDLTKSPTLSNLEDEVILYENL